MFTGIVTAVGRVADIAMQKDDGRFRFATGELPMSDVKLGDSIAVNGACLTVIELHNDGFSADLSQETLACTTMSERKVGHAVNLEKALALGEALGGHLVTGHVDGVATVSGMTAAGESLLLTIEAPQELARYIATKGSVCVDGVSLTVNSVNGAEFELMIVPHTQSETVIAGYKAGTRVNIEVDIIARYVERLAERG